MYRASSLRAVCHAGATAEPIETITRDISLTSTARSESLHSLTGAILLQRGARVAGNVETKTDTALRDVPQSISMITSDLIKDQNMLSMADVARFVPGFTMGQGEGHRDAPTLRGNSTTADFFVDGVRDDVQYFRDLYNAERTRS